MKDDITLDVIICIICLVCLIGCFVYGFHDPTFFRSTRIARTILAVGFGASLGVIVEKIWG